MLSNIVDFYVTLNDTKRAIQIKWIKIAYEQSGEYFDEALVKIVQPVEYVS